MSFINKDFKQAKRRAKVARTKASPAYLRLIIIAFNLAIITSCTQKLSTASLSSLAAGGGTNTTTPAGSIPAVYLPTTCSSPVTPVVTSSPTAVVGTGTAASCTEAAFAKAIAQGGIITFNCGGAATISITSQKTLRSDVNTTIDGANQITLDGSGSTRILYFSGPSFQQNTVTLTLQNLIFKHGKSTGTMMAPAPLPCSQGYTTDAGGGALWMQDGKLHVINTQFVSNQGAAIGPDVGGGALYVLGNLETVISGSTFTSNTASNGGAIGSLFGNLSIYNSSFSSNSALGNGGNTSDQTKCAVQTSGGYEVGSGGNGGAISIDGAENYAVTVCGSTFSHNQGGLNALAGAIFRTPDGAQQTTSIDRSTFDSNSSPTSAGALYFHNSILNITNSTFSNNVAGQSAGAIFDDGTTLNFTNVTFFNNVAQKGLGGALFGGDAGVLQNVTFANNSSTGGSGYFGGATAITSSSLVINNSLFSNNATASCGAPIACQIQAAGSLNFQWPMMGPACTTADQLCTASTIFKNPQLANALANNGGPTMTLLPGTTSVALGAGQNCPRTDQRGKPRPANGCTLGAVEGSQ